MGLYDGKEKKKKKEMTAFQFSLFAFSSCCPSVPTHFSEVKLKEKKTGDKGEFGGPGGQRE